MRGVPPIAARLATCAALVAAATVATAQEPASPPPAEAEEQQPPPELPHQWVEVSDGVFAALQPPGNRFNDSNSVVIVGDSDVVVVDTQNYPRTNRLLIEKIRQATGKPVRYLINTHWHGDHTQGNAVYRRAFAGLEILGHPTLAEDIPGRAAPMLEEQMAPYRQAIPEAEARLARGVSRSGEPLDEEGKKALARQIADARGRLAEMEAVEFAVPDVQVDDLLLLERGGRQIEIRHYRAHTRGDLVVFLPREKILVTGDVLDDLPYGGHGYPRQWVRALAELEKLDFEILIPGHGRLRQGKSHLRLVREMLETIVRAAERASRAGTGLEELQATIDLDRYRRALAGDDPVARRAFEAFVPPAVERAWLEARGALAD